MSNEALNDEQIYGLMKAIDGYAELCTNAHGFGGMGSNMVAHVRRELESTLRAVRALASLPEVAETSETVPWPIVARYSGGASKEGVAGRVWLRLGDGPEEVEYVPAASESNAALDVLAERQRQQRVEGWTAAHDDAHDDGSMAIAAACYAVHSGIEAGIDAGKVDRYADPYLRFDRFVPDFWPWSSAWWKPHGTRRNLVRAGALILAEIERLDRAAIDEATKP